MECWVIFPSSSPHNEKGFSQTSPELWRRGDRKCKYLKRKYGGRVMRKVFCVLSSNILCHVPIKLMIKISHYMKWHHKKIQYSLQQSLFVVYFCGKFSSYVAEGNHVKELCWFYANTLHTKCWQDLNGF